MAVRIPDNPSDLATFSQTSWDDLDGFYSFWTERWKRSIDYIRSLHWRAPQELSDSQIPAWRRFPVVNMTLSVYNDYLAQWLQSRVRFSAIPDSPDPKDIASAELADQVLKYLWDRLDLETKKIDIGAWLMATGNADVRIFWNANTGDLVPLAIPGPEGKLIPVNPETLQPDPSMQQPVMLDAGEIGLEVISPQLVRWSPERAKGAMVGFLLSYDDVLGRYGEDVAKKLTYGKTAGALSVDLLSLVGSNATMYTEETALVIEHYLPRSFRHPNGLWWTSSKRQIITPPNNLPAGQMPLVHFRWIPLPGHPTMGLTPLHDLTFSNKVYDEILAKQMEWLNRVVPKVIRKTGDGLKLGEITEEPGQELIVQPGAEPVWPQLPAPPEQFYRTKQDAAEDMLLVGGYRFRRQKEMPPGEAMQRVRSAPRTTNEGSEVALAVVNSKSAWQRLGHILLSYAAKFYTEPRVISVIGADRTYQWREFSGADLANLPATLHIDELSLYTWNRQSMKDSVIAVLGTPAAGVLFAGPDGNLDRDRVNAAMDAVGIDVSADTLDPNVLEARNENHDFRSLTGQEGQPVPEVAPWQDHQTHAKEHTRELKGMSFRSWPQPAQQAFLQHISQHEKAVAEAAQAEQEQMLGQEKALREIRATAETQQDVRTEFGKKLVEALMMVLTEDIGGGPPKLPKKKPESK